MHPDVGGVHLYPLFVVAAGGVGIGVATRGATRAGFALRPFVLLVVGVAASGLIGAKAWAIVERVSRGAQVADIVASDAIRYPGGVLAMMIIAPILARAMLPAVPIVRVVDVLAAAIPFATATGRVGCFLTGCCFGVQSGRPWALTFPRGSRPWVAHWNRHLLVFDAATSLPVHPLQLYFLVWALGVGFVLSRLSATARRPGVVAAWFLVLHEGGKAALELLRDPDGTNLVMLPLTSGSLALAGGLWLALSSRAVHSR